MVKFKTIKFKHYRHARELMARDDSGEDVEVEYLTYAISVVDEWDFIDDETKEDVPVAASSIDEMSLAQIKEVCGLFNQIFSQKSGVKKRNDGPSYSTLTPSKPDASQAPTPQSGYIPLYSPAE